MCVCVYICMYFHHKLIEILDALLGLVLTEGSGVEKAHGGIENALQYIHIEIVRSSHPM